MQVQLRFMVEPRIVASGLSERETEHAWLANARVYRRFLQPTEHHHPCPLVFHPTLPLVFLFGCGVTYHKLRELAPTDHDWQVELSWHH